MPATGSRAARAAFELLMARCAAGLRAGSAVAAGTAAFVGLAPPASAATVTVAVLVSTVWAAVYAATALRHGWRRWAAAADLAIAAALCLAQGHLAAGPVLTDATSWVFLVASTTVIVSQLSPWPLLGAAATVVVPGSYVAGLALSPGVAPSGAAVLLVAQGTLLGALMLALRRVVRAADQAVGLREAAEREAAVGAARRAEQREHDRMLHDSVSATLTVVAAGGIAGSSPVLRAQAARDLDVIERLHAPASSMRPSRQGDLAGWLGPVLAAADPAVPVSSAVSSTAVPAEVGDAFAGAVAEALVNVARHAGPSTVSVRAGAAPGGGALVEVVDDGSGFDPAAVPASRRGVRESLAGRMRSVGGSAAVESAPGRGTRVVLRWPAESVATNSVAAEPEPRTGDRTDQGIGEIIRIRYRHGVDLAVVWLVAAWHVGNDLLATVSWSTTYLSLAVELLAWSALAGVGAAGAVRLLRRREDRAGAWLLAGAALLASAAGTAAVPGWAIFTGANWTWGAAGWFGVLLLLRRPPAELLAFVVANSAFTLVLMLYDGALDRVAVARFATVFYGTSALQLTLMLAAHALDGTARTAGAVAEAEAGVRRRQHIADDLHARRKERYGTVRRSVAPLLSGLASGQLDPADRAVRHRCAVEASRLRRLFAETDDVTDPLLHELQACSYIADQRGVLVDLQVMGRLPGLGLSTRRALTEAPLLALAGAERHARVTVVGRSDSVAISVLVDRSASATAAETATADVATAEMATAEMAAEMATEMATAEPAPTTDPAVTVTVVDRADQRWVEAQWRV